jgi:A/G-specific adenine glycosylase
LIIGHEPDIRLTVTSDSTIRVLNSTLQIRRAMAPRKKNVIINKGDKSLRLTKVVTPTILSPPETPPAVSLPPSRAHQPSYHYPLLVNDQTGCDALLSWFRDVEKTRNMPWRKTWINPKDFDGSEEELDRVLGQRAYEVWVSEVSK